MVLRELKAKINELPEDFDDYNVTCTLSDYEVESDVKDVVRILFMDDKTILFNIAR